MTPSEAYAVWIRLNYPQMVAYRELGDGRYVLGNRLLFHYTLIVGDVGDVGGYRDRWCYNERDEVRAAALAWDGNGDPPGRWHRHPGSGRRREWNAAGELVKEWVDG